MKQTLLIAAFIAAGAGAVGATVGAISLNGSDTLFDVTNDLVTPGLPTTCALINPAGTITYLGGGSGTGESQMVNGAQAVAPMSKMMDNKICKAQDGGAVTPTSAAGLVIGLDGVAVLTSTANGGSATCNGAVPPSNACTTPGLGVDTTTGLDINRAITACGITFSNWRDILKMLYYGKNQSNTINCDDPVRVCLANNYGALFENASCTGPGDATTGGSACVQIRHLFRRDDSSGTTDIFGSLLGFSGPNANAGPQITAKMATKAGSKQYYMGSDSFCNNSLNLASPFNATPPGQMPGQENTNSAVTPYLFNDAQDRDPIRRECYSKSNGAEQVCEGATYDPSIPSCTTSAQCNASTSGGVCSQTKDCQCLGGQCWNKKGTLGLVLPVVTANQNLATDQYHLNTCDTYMSVLAPVYSVGGVLTSGLCPNGDIPLNGTCYVPADDTSGTANPNCLADTSTTNGPAQANGQGIIGSDGNPADSNAGPGPSGADPRVFNNFVYKKTAGGWLYALDDTQRPVAGSAFYRIHSNQTIEPAPVGGVICPGCPPPPAGCTYADATDQIGCLVVASPCSSGYAGRGAINDANTTSLRVLGVPSAETCIQSFDYPYTRKLYLSSLVGFPSLTAPESQLAACETNATIVNAALTKEGFVPIPDGTTGVAAVNGGKPFCEDYNEQMLCGSASNTDACPAAQAAGIGAGLETICGNGVKEAFEDCDLGAAVNGTTGASCSNTCRNN
jgi:hypothetical protein